MKVFFSNLFWFNVKTNLYRYEITCNHLNPIKLHITIHLKLLVSYTVSYKFLHESRSFPIHEERVKCTQEITRLYIQVEDRESFRLTNGRDCLWTALKATRLLFVSWVAHSKEADFRTLKLARGSSWRAHACTCAMRVPGSSLYLVLTHRILLNRSSIIKLLPQFHS